METELQKRLIESQDLLLQNYRLSLEHRDQIIKRLKNDNNKFVYKQEIFESNSEYYQNKIPNIKHELKECMENLDDLKDKTDENTYLNFCNRLKEIYEILDELDDFFGAGY